jgi:uncharacterized repeat protein (TIGR03803 family)
MLSPQLMRREEFMKQDPALVCSALVVVIIAGLIFAPEVRATSKFKTLHTFSVLGKYGRGPSASMVLDKKGNLYGTTPVGGAGGVGTVFELSPTAEEHWTPHLLHAFEGPDGSYPNGPLIFDDAGNLYGTAQQGGVYGEGSVFELVHTADGLWKESTLYSFENNGKDGQMPLAGLIFDKAGNLYGTTKEGGAYGRGSIFRLTRHAGGSWGESVLHSFAGGDGDGSFPRAGLIVDAAGSLYGTTVNGGPNNDGTVFKLQIDTNGVWIESVLHNFAGTDGSFPIAGLTFDQTGDLYGTTYLGGSGYGVVFKLKLGEHEGWKETVIHSFQVHRMDGITPFATPAIDAAGNLYGTTLEGGSHGYGTVFKLARTSGGWKSRVVHAFRDHPGSNSYSGLIFDAAGNLYGTDSGDGQHTCGSVFQILP